MNKVSFIRGINGKPAASQALEEILAAIAGLSGECFFGYPLIPTPEGRYFTDAILVSREKGVILFDLVEGTELGDYAARQDDLANKIEAKLKLHKELVKGRRLIPPLNVITFAPAIDAVERLAREDYPLSNERSLEKTLSAFSWQDSSDDLYRMTLSAIESLLSIRKNRSKREASRLDSRDPDHRQNRAVIGTADGLSLHEKQRLEQRKTGAIELADALERGEITPYDLDIEVRERLLRLLGDGR